MASAENGTSDEGGQVSEIVFTDPLVQLLAVERVQTHCSLCFAKGTEETPLQRCSQCKHFRYCSKDCQVKGWVDHKAECKLLRSSARLPPTEIILIARLIEKRAKLKKLSCEVLRNGEITTRSWDTFMTHETAIRADEEKQLYFNAVKKELQSLFGPSRPLPKEEELFIIFCKKIINTHGLTDNKGAPMGAAIDLAISAYDHSCRPNIGIVFDGSKVIFRCLEPGLDLKDTGKCFVNYCELAAPRETRQLELLNKYYFECRCERCRGTEDLLLSSILCPTGQCEGPIPLPEIPPEGRGRARKKPQKVPVCNQCRKVMTDEEIKKGFEAMQDIDKWLEQQDPYSHRKGSDFLKNLDSLIAKHDSVLHSKNIALVDLYCIYLQQALAQESNLTIACEYGILALPALRLCYPPKFKQLGFHILKIAYAYLLLEKPDLALPYLQEGTDIFEVWFGPEHRFTKQLFELREKVEKRETSRESVKNLFLFR